MININLMLIDYDDDLVWFGLFFHSIWSYYDYVMLRLQFMYIVFGHGLCHDVHLLKNKYFVFVKLYYPYH